MIFRSTVHHRNRWSVVRHLEASYDGGVVQRPRGVVRRRCRTTPGGVVTTVVSYDTSRRRTTPPSSSHRTLGNQRPINVDYLFGTCLAVASSSVRPPHMTENLVHPPVLQYRAISRNIRLFWDALGVICAWVPLGLAGGVVRGVNGGRRARSRPNLAKFQNLRTPSGVDEL